MSSTRNERPLSWSVGLREIRFYGSSSLGGGGKFWPFGGDGVNLLHVID